MEKLLSKDGIYYILSGGKLLCHKNSNELIASTQKKEIESIILKRADPLPKHELEITIRGKGNGTNPKFYNKQRNVSKWFN